MEVLVNVTIDGQQTSVRAGTTVLDAAKKLGIPIPTFCYYAKLVGIGACRMCLVEVEKMRGLQTACTTKVQEGMVVRTNTPEVIKTRQGVLEFLLTNHPLDCPICDKGGVRFAGSGLPVRRNHQPLRGGETPQGEGKAAGAFRDEGRGAVRPVPSLHPLPGGVAGRCGTGRL
jgi:ferredoxin